MGECINEGAKYVLIDKVLVDYRDIKKMEHIGYERKADRNEPNIDRPAYRIYFTDGTAWEKVLDKSVIERYNELVKGEE